MIYLDATCPLVSKVHVEAERHYAAGREIVLIGHAGHPEVVGTMGQLPPGAMTLIETVEDAEAFAPRDPANLAFVTQTTLSVDDTAEIVDGAAPPLPGDRRAAQGRHLLRHHQPPGGGQGAGRRAATCCWWSGARNSSNSVRLVEVALTRRGARRAADRRCRRTIDWAWFDGVPHARPHRRRLRARGSWSQGVIAALSERYDVEIEEMSPRARRSPSSSRAR